ncbi:unnamed protein product [Spirodela intermedia]|uniref:Uncharacterized protein n=1 Tax=Spirodela intermedia TaxID=51605 RepID=A0A7I8JLW7_SPIIN|nr:unnamed protein product [Spirodela intermedia]CAA6670815.1 unnamed protein product [Spirodela intermedia]
MNHDLNIYNPDFSKEPSYYNGSTRRIIEVLSWLAIQ